jgi:predicted RNA-binding protein with PIN domain
MADAQYENDYRLVENIIDYAIVTNADAICVFRACHFSGSRRVGVIGKSLNSCGDPKPRADW